MLKTKKLYLLIFIIVILLFSVIIYLLFPDKKDVSNDKIKVNTNNSIDFSIENLSKADKKNFIINNISRSIWRWIIFRTRYA